MIDAAANASVLAGVGNSASSRQLIENNLYGTVNLLEYCKRHRAGFLLLSTSRVYGIRPLARLATKVENAAFAIGTDGLPEGMTSNGITERFTTSAPYRYMVRQS